MLLAVAAPPQFDNLEQHVVFECVIFLRFGFSCLLFLFSFGFPPFEMGFHHSFFLVRIKIGANMAAAGCRLCGVEVQLATLSVRFFFWLWFWLILNLFEMSSSSFCVIFGWFLLFLTQDKIEIYFFANWFKFENSRFCPNGTSEAEPLPSFDQLENKIVVFDLNVIFESPVWNLT